VPIGGVVEVSEFDPAHDLAWIGVSGVSQRGRFRIRDNGNGQTKVIFRLSYESAGNLLGLIADRVAARQAARNMTAPLKNLKRMLETSSQVASEECPHRARRRSAQPASVSPSCC